MAIKDIDRDIPLGCGNRNCCFSSQLQRIFPVIYMNKSLGESVGLPIVETTINVPIHEKNSGSLMLAKILPLQFIPWSKHYAAKTIYFRDEIIKCGIKLCKIDTVERLGDIFTKWLKRVILEYLQNTLWASRYLQSFFCCHPLERKYHVSVPPRGCTS